MLGHVPQNCRILTVFGWYLWSLPQDNNTWNNTHIATVGRAMSSPEAKAYAIFDSLDVNYVLVVFGGMVRTNTFAEI